MSLTATFFNYESLPYAKLLIWKQGAYSPVYLATGTADSTYYTYMPLSDFISKSLIGTDDSLFTPGQGWSNSTESFFYLNS